MTSECSSLSALAVEEAKIVGRCGFSEKAIHSDLHCMHNESEVDFSEDVQAESDMKNGLSHCRWPSGSSSQFKQTVALLKAKTDSYLGSRIKQTVALLTANTDSYLGSQLMSRLSQHCVNDVEVVVVANCEEKCAKCITQWICCTPYKAEAVCNPDEYSLATLQTAKKDLVIAECEGRLSWSMSS